MKPINKTQRQAILADLLDPGEDFRAASLTHALSLARRRRARRRMAAPSVMFIAGLFAFFFIQKSFDSISSSAIAPSPPPVSYVPGTAIELINDEALYATLQGRSFAIIGEGEERRLVLLDEWDVASANQIANAPEAATH